MFQITQDMKVKSIIVFLLSIFLANANSIPVTTSTGYSLSSFLVFLTLFGHTHFDIQLKFPIHMWLAQSFALICCRWLYHDDAVKSVIL